MFERIAEAAAGNAPWRRIPAEYGVDGFYCRYERHFIYWKRLADGSLAISLVLHERMQQIDPLREAFASKD